MCHGLYLNGIFYKLSNLADFALTAKTDQENLFYKEIIDFIEEWFSSKSTVLVHTSGSTGEPKQLEVRKVHMRNSAHLTCSYLNLKPQDNILLCMSIQYIAGKMMLVRALECQLRVWAIPPSGRPLRYFSQSIDFAAMVPLQAYNSLLYEEDKERLKKVQHLLIGGGAINGELERKLRIFPNRVYSSYGMTETVSHIALRELSGEAASEWYQPLESVQLSLSARGTLKINAPKVSSKELETNDVVVLNHQGFFKVVGRADNIINSGGIKIQAEKVEEKLHNLIPFPHVITSRPDRRLGEAVVLLIEAETLDLKQLAIDMKKVLNPYEIPKSTYLVAQLPLTETKKIKRTDCKKWAQKLSLSDKL